MILHTISDRIYADFLMPSRLSEYGRMLETALEHGYRIMSVEHFWDLAKGSPMDDSRRFILRHDIDTDPRTAAAMWRIEQSLGIESSYYFRLSTLDRALARSIGEGGSQVSYHYEELATIAKRRGLRDPDRALAHLPEAQDLFAGNIARLRAETGFPMRVVASHGDFVNRIIGVPNWRILEDRAFRDEVGVDLEVYDQAVMQLVSSRHSDTLHPTYWRTGDPVDAVLRGEPATYVLVHPRHWHVDRLGNAVDDIVRLGQGVTMHLPRPSVSRRR
jgi:hypothetical protein